MLPDWMRYEFRHRWERFQNHFRRLPIRKWINENPRIIVGLTVVSALVLLVIVIRMLVPNRPVTFEDSEKSWFYDLNTGKLFAAKSELVPPIEAPSGPLSNGEPAGVLAYVFSYSSEPNESQRFIGFLEIPDPNFSPNSANSQLSGAKRWGQGKLIRRVEDKQWVSANSKEGQAILREFFQPNEEGEVAVYHLPE